jgi:hypothetical protein
MPLKFSAAVRNARLDQIESTIGTSPKLQIRTGAPPASITDADSGTLLVEFTLPSDWMANASGGSKAKQGTWQANAVASGIAGHFRVKDSAGTTTHIQGTVAQGSGGDLNVDNTNIATGQQVTISTFNLTDGNA